MLGQNSILNSSDHNKEKGSYKHMSGNEFFSLIEILLSMINTIIM